MEPQEDSRQRRRGPISHGIDFLNTGRTIWQGAKLVRTAGVFAGALNPATIAIAVGAIIVLLVFFIVLDTGTGIAEGVPGDGTEQPTNPTLPPVDGDGTPPSADNCNGEYSLNSPLRNFGDPQCTFTKDQLYSVLKSQDSANADYWYFKIVPCESGYNPNSYRDPNIKPHTPDPAGAWGLYQMGRGRNGQYDHGDVVWQQQIGNAINYNQLLRGSFAYWECAR